MPRPLITKWCLDDSPVVSSAADLRESARSSFAAPGEFSTPNVAAAGRAISLIPLTEDAATAAEVFVTTATTGNGLDGEVAEQFAPFRLAEDQNAEGSGEIIILRDNEDDGEADQTKPKFATQKFDDFVDFGNF